MHTTISLRSSADAETPTKWEKLTVCCSQACRPQTCWTEGWWCWLQTTSTPTNQKTVQDLTMPSLNHFYKTPYYPVKWNISCHISKQGCNSHQWLGLQLWMKTPKGESNICNPADATPNPHGDCWGAWRDVRNKTKHNKTKTGCWPQIAEMHMKGMASTSLRLLHLPIRSRMLNPLVWYLVFLT